ncbi:MAG: hypothetical protein U0636_10205 [Phycisphaerales bacterium]
MRWLVLVWSALLLSGCAGPPNPSLPITTQEAYRALHQMAADPRPAPRPVVVVGGYADPGLATASVKQWLAPCLKDTTLVVCAPGSASSFDEARTLLLGAVQSACPCADATCTVEVDAVCVSMGGLVAIHAADPQAASAQAGTRTLKVVRVFTIGSPLRGADAAKTFPISDLAKDMRAGSAFLARVDAVCAAGLFALYPYTRADDTFVGAVNTAPPGQVPWWVPGQFGYNDHFTAHEDPRILADIARRLRGEEPFSTLPRAPLP